MILLLFIFIGTVIVVAIVLATFVIIDMYQRLDDRGYIDQWLDRKFSKIKMGNRIKQTSLGVYIESNWVLCSEELPSLENPVLLWTIQESGVNTDKRGRWRIGTWCGKGWVRNQLRGEKIVAWHLLPEPFDKKGGIVIE